MSRRGWTWSGLPGLCGLFIGFTPSQIKNWFSSPVSQQVYSPSLHLLVKVDASDSGVWLHHYLDSWIYMKTLVTNDRDCPHCWK